MDAPAVDAPAVGPEADPLEGFYTAPDGEDPPPPGETGRELGVGETLVALEEAFKDTVPAASAPPHPFTLPLQEDWQGFPPRPAVGDTLLVNIGEGQLRPMLVTTAEDGIVSGVVFCDPGDHTLPAFRGHGAFSGRPDRFTPFGTAEGLTEGWDVGQWRRRTPPHVTRSTSVTLNNPTSNEA